MGMPSCVPIFILLFLSSSCRSDDQLTDAKPLSSGDTLVSKGGDFALGFFSPDGSNTSLYLSIWYHNIPGRTVVWTANRDNPIAATSSPMLAITNSSDLVLSDSQGRIPWATKNNIAGMGVVAVLLDTGNLVLQFLNGTTIWQSFDHPTDTILPGTRLFLSDKARIIGRLVAWRGPLDPSTGDFSLSLDLSSGHQLVIWNGTMPYTRLSMFSGSTVDGRIYQNTIIYEAIVGTGDGFYYEFSVSAGSPYARLTLDYTGMLRSLSWNNNSSWTTTAEDPSSSCDLYASCGPFGYCDNMGVVATCRCLDGFEPIGLNFSSGCRRIKALECSRQSHFVTLSRMKVPAKSFHVLNRSFDECTAECTINCSCTAYTYTNLNSNDSMADQSRCLIWTTELVDTGKYSNRGENLFVRLADSPVQKNRRLLKIVLPAIACLLILTCIALVGICKYRASKQRKNEIQKRVMPEYLSSSNGTGGESIELPFVSFEDIAAATDNFSDLKQIGKGGFGKVYKGMLDGLNNVAIKRLSIDSEQGIKEFKNEVDLIARLQHRNLVRLLGCCIHGDERLLIYEYLPNKSLDAFLFDATKQYVLDWPTRYNIINGVARGLLYLHQDSRLTIIHRDLKASNILLDSEMTPKISDFGMARIFRGNQRHANTSRVVGTYGYMSPEYVMGGAFSVKSDTYSFGVLILEIVSGLKISSPQLIMNFSSLTTYAWRLWQDGKATELVHSSVIQSCPLHVLRCIHVGLLCVQDHPDDRPLMSSVIFMLENESALLPAPKQPAYFAMQNWETQGPRESMENSANGVSITTLEGR
ncbi:G-type lectin S-receptor-like serine/threonine-protein kinase B120 [Lolium perenne]|uniref:G-type lectin S-receptor-like serine/threonine-protein kinase B120 n=1 Tax=Lolium perenne TaxID=4522 RepID=UPI0021F61B55|nr:G-type lectin S-receptor-like serine/threonine-protein kinase B120 isoform X1 [Lolium perenne]XP_051218836.1 G-type lectin S-receptor-like serine/threonine-protein kinase B120 isoform X1 [Lolium perenne]XP_051218837.1 G-type lectin S-receptor-like serine/threonine-protein kinase B120 isoform X1 [Lolium perenne]